jgi:hypothetical protein
MGGDNGRMCSRTRDGSSRQRRQFVIMVKPVTGRILLQASIPLAALICLASCRTVATKPKTPEKPPTRSAAVAAYYKSMEDRLGPIWYKLCHIRQDELHLGTVETAFEIPAAGGKVRNVRVTSNTGGRMDELVACRAIDQLRAPPIPATVLSEAKRDYLAVEETFTIFAKP